MTKNGGASLGEILFILAMFLPTLLMGILKAWPLFWVFVIFDVCFGLTEWYYTARTDKTVSQHFWEYSRKHRGRAIAILVSMGLMWAALMYHLGYKMFQ